jgi:hypothetical protein
MDLLNPTSPGPHAPLSAEKLADHEANVAKFPVGTRVHVAGAMFGRSGRGGLITELGSDVPAVYEVEEITPLTRFPCSTGGSYLAGPFWKLRSLGNTITPYQEQVVAARMSLV